MWARVSKTMTIETTRPQDVPTLKPVAGMTFILTVAVTFLATLVLTTIGCWFLFESMRVDARAAVIQDMKIISKTVEQ
jgi:hypothetical protein